MGRQSEAAEVRRVSTSLQILAVRRLCAQLDTTWQYFTNTFKMQVTSILSIAWLSKPRSQSHHLAVVNLSSASNNIS